MYGTKYFDENFLGKSQIMGNTQYTHLARAAAAGARVRAAAR
jgi:hypothetical protein